MKWFTCLLPVSTKASSISDLILNYDVIWEEAFPNAKVNENQQGDRWKKAMCSVDRRQSIDSNSIK